MKTLKQLLELKKPEKPQPSFPIEPDSVNALVPRTKDERRFYDKHVIQKIADRNGNDDEMFNAAKIKAYDRSASNHGYNTGEDEKVYESVQQNEAINPDNPRDYNKPTWMRLGQRRYAHVAKKAKEPLTLKDVEDRDTESPTTSAGLAKKAKKLGIDEHNNSKTLMQILGEKTLTSAEMKKREEIAKAIERDNPEMKKSKKMAIATATAKRVAEETELNEAAMADIYHNYHNQAKNILGKISKGLDQHSKHVTDKSNYNGGQIHAGHMDVMKSFYRQVQDMHDQLMQQIDYAKPPEKIREQYLNMFSTECQEEVTYVYTNMNEEGRAFFMQLLDEGKIDDVVEALKIMEEENSNG